MSIDKNMKEIVIWVILAVTTMGVAGAMLDAANHSSDNQVRIQQIKDAR